MERRGLADTHCHLNHEQFDLDRDSVIARAREVGIERLLVIGFDLASSRFALELALAHPDIQAVIGIHPEAADEWSTSAWTELMDMAHSHMGKVVGWGEIGLDYHWMTAARELQQRVFEEQIECARELDLPVVVHCRDAYGDVLDTLERLDYRRAVLHCFTGSAEEAQRAVDLDLYLGVGGIATFKKSEYLRSALRSCDIDRLIVETDCPYLAPQRWRGKRNEPSYITAVVDVLAELKVISYEEMVEATTANADRLFGAMKDQHLVDR